MILGRSLEDKTRDDCHMTSPTVSLFNKNPNILIFSLHRYGFAPNYVFKYFESSLTNVSISGAV